MVIPENYIPVENEECVACGGALFRHPFSNIAVCDKWHGRYLGPQDAPTRYILRQFHEDEYDRWTENKPAWCIWDNLIDGAVLDHLTDEYAWDLSEARARSWFARL